MKIIIVGYGKVGTTLAEQLNREHHDVTLIDSNGEALQAVADSISVTCVTGNGVVYQVQMEAGTKKVDLLIATTNSDELSMLCCLIVKKAGNCHTITRIRNPGYSAETNYVREELDLSLATSPGLAAAREIVRLLHLPNAIEIEPFAKGRIELLKFRIPKGSCLDQARVLETVSRLKSNMLICVVEHGEDVVIPDGNFVVLGGDKISFIAPHSDPAEFFRKAGIENNTVNPAMFVDGGRLTVYLAKALTGAKIKIKIIEGDEERCRLLSELLLEAVIIHGDGSDQQLLLEGGIRQTEAFAPLTGSDEENIMLSLYAVSQSRAKLVTKASKITFENVINSLNLGSVIYPKILIADVILQYVCVTQDSMGSNMETSCRIVADKAEILKLGVREHSPAVGVSLETLKLRSNLLVACTGRDGKFITPRGRNVIQIGDSVITVATHTGLSDLKDILG